MAKPKVILQIHTRPVVTRMSGNRSDLEFSWHADMSGVTVISRKYYTTDKAALRAARQFMQQHFPTWDFTEVEVK